MSKRSLFKEYIHTGEFINYNNIYANSEIPLKSQLQQLLANLPDEEQLAAFEGDIKTLKTSIDAMKFESPSVKSAVSRISTDVMDVRVKLRNITSSIEQLVRNLGLSSTSEQDIEDLEGDTVESMAPYTAKMFKEGIDVNNWSGASRGKLASEFDKKALLSGARIEMNHLLHLEDDDLKKKIAIRIAMDHLTKDPTYYEKLKSIGKPEPLKETPDVVKLDGKKLKWDDPDAYAFGIAQDTENFLIGKNLKHMDLIDKGGKLQYRDGLQYPGRLWVDRKVISFWGKYPDYNKMIDIRDELEDALNISIDNAWKIDVPNKFFGSKLISFTEYIASAKPTNYFSPSTPHTTPPVAKVKDSNNYGKKISIQQRYANEKEPIAEYKDKGTL